MAHLLNVEEVMELTGAKQSTAYRIIREVNAEMEKRGFLTLRGKVNKTFLCERLGIPQGDISPSLTTH